MTEQEKREKVIKGLEAILEDTADMFYRSTIQDALALLKAQEPVDYMPIDWLMNYAQLPTEFAISAWRKPKKESEIKQAKSLDKPMSLDDALELLKAQELRVMTATEAYTADYVYIEFDGVITPAIRTTNERDGHRESYFATQQLGGDWMRWDDYGITWRCWTSHPTDEQREATPWEG